MNCVARPANELPALPSELQHVSADADSEVMSTVPMGEIANAAALMIGPAHQGTLKKGRFLGTEAGTPCRQDPVGGGRGN